MHKVTLQDHLRQASSDIVSILANPIVSTTVSLQIGDPIQNALLQIATLAKISHKMQALPLIKIPIIL